MIEKLKREQMTLGANRSQGPGSFYSPGADTLTIIAKINEKIRRCEERLKKNPIVVVHHFSERNIDDEYDPPFSAKYNVATWAASNFAHVRRMITVLGLLELEHGATEEVPLDDLLQAAKIELAILKRLTQ